MDPLAKPQYTDQGEAALAANPWSVPFGQSLPHELSASRNIVRMTGIWAEATFNHLNFAPRIAVGLERKMAGRPSLENQTINGLRVTASEFRRRLAEPRVTGAEAYRIDQIHHLMGLRGIWLVTLAGYDIRQEEEDGACAWVRHENGRAILCTVEGVLQSCATETMMGANAFVRLEFVGALRRVSGGTVPANNTL